MWQMRLDRLSDLPINYHSISAPYSAGAVRHRHSSIRRRESDKTTYLYSTHYFFQFKENNNYNLTSLVAWWLELLTTNHDVPGSIPGSTMYVFP